MNLVLIVDDVQFERRRLAEAACREGLAFAEASNGVEALAVVDRLRPDLILTDLMMPVMDGLTFVRELRRKSINTPVVAITSDQQDYTRQEFLKLGAHAVLSKPWDHDDVSRLLRNVRIARADEIA